MVDEVKNYGNNSAYDYIRSWVVSIDSRSGEFLREEALAKAIGTSRTPVREALRWLQAEGLVSIVPQKGAYVPPIPANELADLMETRLTLEMFAAPRAVAAREEIGATLTSLLDEAAEILGSENPDIQRFFDCDLRFHGMILRSTNNQVMSAMYESLRARQLRMAVTAVKREGIPRLQDALSEHRKILSAIKAADNTALREAIVHHNTSTLAAAVNLNSIQLLTSSVGSREDTGHFLTDM